MMKGEPTCPLNKPYHDIGSAFNGSCFPGWRRHWVRWASAQRLVGVVELVRVEEWLPTSRGWRGRPLEDRAALARAFLAKAVLDVPTTRALVERLRTEPTLRRLCGWEAAGGVPSEATFSRAFAEFAADLPGRLHEALLDRTLKGHLAGHVSRDSTAIGGRESPAPKPAPTARPKRRRGRPRKDELRAKEPRRLERQASMTLQMLEDLPRVCDIGVKRNAKGYQESWTGWLHIDAIDGGIPVSCLLTSAYARLSGGDPAGEADRESGRQPLRPDGQRL